MKHYRFGGSTASRTWHCAAWRQLADALPQGDGTGSEFARRGTLCHNAMEDILGDKEVEPASVIGMVYEDQVMTEELFKEKIVPALAAFEELCEKYGIDEWVCESESMLADDVGGTSDLIGAGERWTMVLDWKFGSGIMVDPTENHQGLFYGAGARHNAEIMDLFEDREHVVIVIVQPGNREGGDYSVWETTMDRLTDYKDQFLAKVEIAQAEDPGTCSGDWCKFCPVAAVCPEKTGAAQRALLLDPKDAETLRESLRLADELKQWIKDVETAGHAELEKGGAIKGWKLVMKRATRKWADTDKAMTYLSRRFGKRNVVSQQLIGVPAAEKLAKASDKELSIDHLVEKKSSGTTLAKTSDKRPAVPSVTSVAAAVKSVH
jgi:hypothetical protein